MSYSLIISVLLGLAVGYFAKLPQGVAKKTSMLQTACLLFMLLFMGIKIGINSEIMKNLGTIGFKASIFALSSIAGSILLVIPVAKLYKRLKGGKVNI